MISAKQQEQKWKADKNDCSENDCSKMTAQQTAQNCICDC